MPTTTPIIVPVVTPKTQTCILQDGKQYCEKPDTVSKKEIGYQSVAFVFIILWILAVGHLLIVEDMPLAALILFLVPFLLVAFACLI